MDHIIANHSLYIDKEFEEFINNFSSTTGSDFPAGKLGNYLGSWYEGYLYCLLIGINTNSRHYSDYINKHQKMPNWSNQNIDQYKYCIARVMSRMDIKTELGLDSRDSINSNFVSTEELLKKVKEICDQFSLGGVHYLKSLYDNDHTIFNNSFSLKVIYENTVKKNH
jgi:hypothetical protein